MRRALNRLLGSTLTVSHLGWLPVPIRAGFARGAWWSLYPWTAYWRGKHEPLIQATLQGLGNMQGWSCWDLGAHYGFYSVGLARRVGPTGAVAAFEPNPLSFRRLLYHRKLNRLDWITPFAAAVSDQAGHAQLYTYGQRESTTTHLPYAGEIDQPACAPIQVATLRLDELRAQGAIRLPDFVKVDVEGHAHRALAGMTETFALRRPIILVAFHGEPEASETRRLLAQFGYRAHQIGASEATPDAQAAVGDFLFTPAG